MTGNRQQQHPGDFRAGAAEKSRSMTSSRPAADGLRISLESIANCLGEIWPTDYPPTGALMRLKDRLVASRFQLAVLGQFKRGKSTLINALLGAEVLPAAAVPLTAISTFISWGSSPSLRVTFVGDQAQRDIHVANVREVRSQLENFVTEEQNPGNVRGVARVDVSLPVETLEGGLVLIDTPGIGSTLQHNTETALQTLPECDAAMFVVSADPPITQAEVAYLAQVRAHAVQVFFVLNKIDYLSPQDVRSVESFVCRTLRSLAPHEPDPPIFRLSARQALAARLRGDEAAVAASGLGLIDEEIIRRVMREKAATLCLSVRRKACGLVDEALGDLALRIRALELPLADLEQRAALFEQGRRAFDEERQRAQDLLAGDKARASAKLEAQAQRLREAARGHIRTIMEDAIRANGGVVDEPRVHKAIADAMPIFFDSKLSETARDLRTALAQILTAHQSRMDDLVNAVRRAAANLFDVPFHDANTADGFQLGPEPYWVTQEARTVLIPSAASLLVRLLPAGPRTRYQCRRLEQEIEHLVQRNVENLRWTALRGLNETFRRFSNELDRGLAQALAVTDGIIEAALERRRSSTEDTAPELARLHGWMEQLDSQRRGLGDGREGR